MTPIRPFESADLGAVARLYEQVARSGTTSPPVGLERYFARTVLEQPFADPDIPSLVYDDPGLGVVGFIASYPRPFTLGDRRLRMACSGQLVTRPDVRSRGIGALLLRAYLAGPQDFSVTDGATDEVREIWERLGGMTNAIASLGWTRVIRPAGFLALEIAQRRAPETAVHATVAPAPTRALDALARPALRPRRPEASSEPLTPAAALELTDRLRRQFPMRPAYDADQLAWLLAEMEVVAPARGQLVRRLVRSRDGRILGWYVAHVPRAGIATVAQVAAAPADVGPVLDELLHQADASGAVAVSGRVDPHLYPELARRRCVFRRVAWALLSSADEELLATVGFGRALLARIDGEAWMGHHILAADALAALPRAT